MSNHLGDKQCDMPILHESRYFGSDLANAYLCVPFWPKDNNIGRYCFYAVSRDNADKLIGFYSHILACLVEID